MRKTILILLLVALVGCAQPVEDHAATTEPQTTSRAGTYLANGASFVKEARAADMEWTSVRIEMGETGAEMWYKPKDITLEAGKPYKLEIVNVGEVDHYFTAEEFFALSAWRKAEDAHGEIKAPFFKEVEVFPGKQTDLYLIPMVPGTYESICELPGHTEAGMFGTITVTGSEPEGLEFKPLSEGDWVQDGPAIISSVEGEWTPARLEMGDDPENGVMWFEPKDLRLAKGMPYKIELINTGSIKHEYAAHHFLPTAAVRKAQTAAAEYKAPVFNEIETFAGEQVDLYLVPTEAGTFDSVCELPGHTEAGMFGTVTVE